MKLSQSFLAVWLVACVAGPFVGGTISPSDKGKKSKAAKELEASSGPVGKSVFDRNLIEDEPFARDILAEHAAYFQNTSARNFDGSVLGYVTPVQIIAYQCLPTWQLIDNFSPF